MTIIRKAVQQHRLDLEKRDKKQTNLINEAGSFSRPVYERNFKALHELGIVQNLYRYTHFSMNSRGLMDLSIDKLIEDEKRIIFSMAHYGEQNGDLMADPDMELLLTKETNEVQALSYRNDYAGFYREVYDNINDPTTVNEELQKESNRFLAMWLSNIKAGGYFLSKYEN